MPHPFENFSYFFWAVYAQWTLLLTGCMVLVVINFIAKAVNKPITIKQDLALLSVLLIYAIFQAWNVEYKRAEILQTQNGALQKKLDDKPPPPQVQVNVPQAQPPTIIVSAPGTPREAGYLQYNSVIPTDGEQKPTVGQSLAMNYSWINRSTVPVKDIKNLGSLHIASPSELPALRKEYAKVLKERLGRAENQRSEDTMAPGEPAAFNSTLSAPLTQEQVGGINRGTMYPVLQYYISWVDDHGSKGTLNYCWIIAPSKERPVVYKSLVILHTCP
jgi:hypothetical protein